MTQASRARGYDELRRNWWILPPTIAGTLLCSAHSYSLGVMIPALEQEFGWLRAEISGGLLIVAVVALFCAPLSGLLTDRIGPRPVALVGIVVFCGAIALLSTAGSSIYSWWLLWLLVAIGNMLVLPAIWTKAISACFDANRGLALAIALTGTGAAAAVIPMFTNFLVGELGWRGAYVALGASAALVVFPLTLFLFRPDRAVPFAQGPLAAPGDAVLVQPGFSPRQGLMMPSFLKLAAATIVFGMAICALTTNGVPVLISRGLSPGEAAAIAGLSGLGSVIGRLGGGFLLDRFDAAKVAAISVMMPIISVSLLLALPGSVPAAIAACLFIGLTVGAEIDCCAYLAARHFGLRSFGTLFGMLNGLLLFGNGISPLLANYIYDLTHSYDLVLWAEIPACIITALLFLSLGPYPAAAEETSGAPAPDARPAAA